MTWALAKYAGLGRLVGWLTRTAKSDGGRSPVQFTSRRSSGNGCAGVTPTGGASCQPNIATPKTAILTPDRLRARATRINNRDAKAVAAYVRRHTMLGKETCSDGGKA